MSENESENPFQSPAVAETTVGNRPNSTGRAIWGTVGISLVVSAGSFIVHPFLGIMVLIASMAAIGRTWISVKRTQPQKGAKAQTVLNTFMGSLVLMGILVFASLLAMALFDVTATAVASQLTSIILVELAIAVAGFFVGGVLFGLGFLALLPPPENSQAKQAGTEK